MTDKSSAGSSDSAKADDNAKADDTAKDMFREALERKRSQQAGRASAGHSDSKIHGEHGAAGGKRTFRRKSG
jgi:hypothetical protein